MAFPIPYGLPLPCGLSFPGLAECTKRSTIITLMEIKAGEEGWDWGGWGGGQTISSIMLTIEIKTREGEGDGEDGEDDK